MPSLFSVSESDPSQSAKAKECGNDIIVLDADTDMNIEVTTDEQSRTDIKDMGLSNHSLTIQSNVDESSIDDRIEFSTETKGIDQIEKISASDLSTPNSKKRRVTPSDDSGSKQKQQKKVNQMTLSSFFFKGSNVATTASTPSKMPNQEATKSPSPPSTSEKTFGMNPAMDPMTIDVDIETDQLQTTSSSSDEVKPPPKKATVSADKIETSIETNLNHGSAVSSVIIPAGSQSTKMATDSSTKTINVLSQSAVKKKTRARPAKPRNTDSSKGKESSARKAKQSASSTKKTKPLDSLATTAVVKKKLSEGELSEENRALLRKYRAMKERYMERVHDVTNKHKDGLQEEDLGTVKFQPIRDDIELKTKDAGQCEEFPSQVVTNMALLIEGR